MQKIRWIAIASIVSVVIFGGDAQARVNWAKGSGDWSATTNWRNGYPGTSDSTEIAPRSGCPETLVVTITNKVPAIANFSIWSNSNGDSYTLDMLSGADLLLDGGKISLVSDAFVHIHEGANLKIDGPKGLPNNYTEIFTVNRGGHIQVEGGVCILTNMYGMTIFGSETDDYPAYTNTIEVSNGGTFAVWMSGRGCYFRPTGKIIVSGGRFDVHQNSDEIFRLLGTELDISGGTFCFGENKASRIGPGRHRLSGCGVLEFGKSRHAISASTDRPVAELEVSGRGTITGNITAMRINDAKGGNTCVRFATEPDVDNNLGHTVYIGADDGRGEVIVDSGLVHGGLYATYIAAAYDTSLSAENCVTGVLRVAGGAYTQKSGSADKATQLQGFIVGNGAVCSDGEIVPGSYVGRLEVSGGAVTNGNAHFVVGVGPGGRGTVIQTGGRIYDNADSSHKMPCVIGLAGGTGLYAISNGTTDVNTSLYVGGATLASLQIPADYIVAYSNNYPWSVRGGTGTLDIFDGTFNVMKSTYVGSDGCGSLRIGPRGRFTTKALVLTVETGRDAGHACDLSFTADDTGVGSVSVSDRVYVHPGTKMFVDFSAAKKLPPHSKWPLLTWANKTGSIRDNVELKVTGPVRVKEEKDGLYAYVKAGFAIVVR